MQQKFYKYDKIRLFAQGDKKYISLVNDADFAVLRFAQSRGYAQRLNDAPRGGKLGEHFLIKRYFDFERMRSSMYAEQGRRQRALNKALKSVLKSETIETFWTISDIGRFKIDNELYSNFSGDGENTVEVCKCSAFEFKNSEIISRRQVYNPNSRLTIVRFDAPKTIKVALWDYDDSHGVKEIQNVLGFCIWERKMKVFVCEK